MSIDIIISLVKAFLILGLPETAPLWSDDYAAWTQKKIWSGENISIDHAH